jgi:hypothetical protein
MAKAEVPQPIIAKPAAIITFFDYHARQRQSPNALLSPLIGMSFRRARITRDVFLGAKGKVRLTWAFCPTPLSQVMLFGPAGNVDRALQDLDPGLA